MKENLKTKNHLNPNHLPDRIYPNNPRYKDLSGKVFGLVSILYPCGRNKDKRVMYVCRCECGQFFQCSGKSLTSGNTKSCGCWHKQRARESNMERGGDLTGQRFGKLMVIKEAGFVEKADRRQSRVWLCKCDCGNSCEVQHTYLTNGDTKSCGCMRSAGEAKIDLILQKRHLKSNFIFSREKTFEDLIFVGKPRFDFAIYKSNGEIICLIEYDGEQHYNPQNGYYNENVIATDKMKIQYCLENDIPLHIIRFDEDIETRMEEIFSEHQL